MISLLLTLIVILVIFALLWWVITLIPFPSGFPVWIIQVILGLCLVIALLTYLTPFLGHSLMRGP